MNNPHIEAASDPGSGKKIRVLIVDDSSLVRRVLASALSADPGIEVVGTAGDPYEAREKIIELNPDVLTLDMEMPRMDGLTFLKILHQHRPIPVIVISTLTKAGSPLVTEALQNGAVDVLAKPENVDAMQELAATLPLHIRGAAAARRPVLAKPIAPAPRSASRHFDPRSVILIGSSTGGIEALCHLLPHLPAGLPPILIAQHIPARFSESIARRLDHLCPYEVREAVDRDSLHPGLALIAPGDFHMFVDWDGNSHRIRLAQTPPIHHCRPSVDVLFQSASRQLGPYTTAVILTGMGSDGSAGMRLLKRAGATTIAQDSSTCVVFGMPRAAIELGVVDHIVPLHQMPQAILDAIRERPTAQRHLINTSPPDTMQTTESPVSALPLETWIKDIVPNVFGTMLGITPAFNESGGVATDSDERITAFVGLGGDLIAGIVYLHFPLALAHKVTASMLGLDPIDGVNEPDVNDVAGELCNMVTGGIKSILSDSNFPCAMSAPAIIRGNGFSVETVEKARREVYVFDCIEYRLVVEIHLNSH